eukprot:8434656-Pyramimonas_sp.AAC.1
MSGPGGKPWPHRGRGRGWYSQLRYLQLHMVGSFARRISLSFAYPDGHPTLLPLVFMCGCWFARGCPSPCFAALAVVDGPAVLCRAELRRA